jgi:septum formation protein
MGLEFTVLATDVDEARLPNERPEDYALRLALEKALVAAATIGRGLVLGADTIVVVDDDLLDKPRGALEAESHLMRLRGRWHDVGTAVAVVDAHSGRWERGIDWTRVRIREFGPDELQAYIASGDPFDKAGGYAIQARPFRPVAEIVGREDTVVGLPCELVARLLDRLLGEP